MVTYTWRDEVKAGVPLGGIGAGKLEINNKGKLVNLTIFGNAGDPIPRARGFHVFVMPEDSEPFFLEKELIVYGMERYESDDLIYEGAYPFFRLRGRKGKVTAELEGFSPIIPRNLEDSTLPAAGFAVRVSGSGRGLVAVSFPNLVGSSPVGRIDERVEGGVRFRNLRLLDFDPRKGEVSLLTDAKGARVVVQYNINLKPEIVLRSSSLKEAHESGEPWLSLMKGDEPEGDVHEVTGLWDDPAGMLILPYEEGAEARFVVSWYATGRWIQHPYGFYYHRRFSSSLEVGEYFLREFDRLRRGSLALHDIKANLPDWLKDAIINSAYILSASTILDERGRFGIYEAPEVCPCVGTIAALCYEGGSLPLVMHFPELEKEFLRLLANSMRDDGYVPHDLGLHSLDLPIDGTTAPPRWKDTNPTFVLLVYRYYKFTGDLDFVRELYPRLLKALEWELRQDRDGDGVPETEGDGDTGFDTTPIKGVDSYTTSLYIASLLALREIARALGDEGTIRRLDGLVEKARKVYASLYNGKYFIAWRSKDEERTFLFMAQLVGEWWVELLGLEKIIDEEKISSALKHLLEVNGRASPYCTPNMVEEDGRVVDMGPQSYSSWPRLVFAIGWLGYKRDRRWLDVVKKEWDNLVRNGLVWNQPSRINSRDGRPQPERYLDHYVGNASIWSFLF